MTTPDKAATATIDRLIINSPYDEPATLRMSSVAEHLRQQIHFDNTLALIPVFDTQRPFRSARVPPVLSEVEGRRPRPFSSRSTVGPIGSPIS